VIDLVKLWLMILLSILFSSSTLYLIEEWGTLSIVFLYSSLITLIFSAIFIKKFKFKYNDIALFLMLVFLISGILSSLINQDSDLFLRAVIYFILLISANIVIPSYLDIETEKITTRLILLTHIPILFTPVIIDGFDKIPYYGIFSNPNSIAGIAVTVLAVFLGLFFEQIENIFFQKRKLKITYIVLYTVAASFLILIISYALSRTSFVTAMVVIMSGVILFLVNAIRLKEFGSILRKGLFFLPPLLIIFYVLNIYLDISASIEDNIVGKFSRKSGNVLSNRDDVWSQAFHNPSFFGNGAHFFRNETGLGAHNTLLSLFGTYGWIPTIAIFLLFMIAFYYVIKYFLKSESKYKYIAPLMLITFLTLSMAEDMNWKLSIIVSLILSGTYMNKKKLRITK